MFSVIVFLFFSVFKISRLWLLNKITKIVLLCVYIISLQKRNGILYNSTKWFLS